MPCLVFLTNKGLFLFRFGFKTNMERTLAAAPYSIGKQKIHLVPWKPGMDDVLLSKTTAVWICIKNIPLHLWSINILTGLASMVGTPIRMDDTTTS